MTAHFAHFGASRSRRMPAELPALRARIDHHYDQYRHGHVTCGRRPGPGDLKLNGNDYLCLGGDPRLAAASQTAFETLDKDVFMSGVYVQHLDAQRVLERRFATFLGSEDAVICQSGFAANEGLIQALADENTPVYIDHFAHASLWQGALVAQAPTHALRHNDPDHLRQLVRRHGPGVVAVDALFSVTGDFCCLEEMIEVCEDEGCTLVVDESHSVGVIGDEGEGLVAALGFTDRVPYRVFSLSKAFVGRGGVIAASSRFIGYFRYESRPAIFSSVVLPSDLARFDAALTAITEARAERTRLFELATRLRRGLNDIGYDTGASTSQIQPLVAGPEQRTAILREALESRGVFGAVFSAPATPRNRSCVRLCVNVGLDEDDIDRVLSVCDEIRDEVRPDQWPSFARRPRRAAITGQSTVAPLVRAVA